MFPTPPDSPDGPSDTEGEEEGGRRSASRRRKRREKVRGEGKKKEKMWQRVKKKNLGRKSARGK